MILRRLSEVVNIRQGTIGIIYGIPKLSYCEIAKTHLTIIFTLKIYIRREIGIT